MPSPRGSARGSARGGSKSKGSSRKTPSSKGKSKSKEQEPLRTLVQQRLLTDVFDNTRKKTPGWVILVLDKYATRVISSALGMYDLMEERVAIVEDLTKKRAPYKDKDVIYLLTQTSDSVDRLIDDWSGDAPLYGPRVFVYFLGRLPDKQLAKIKKCKQLVKRLKALSEVNVDFLAKEKRVFHLDMRSSFTKLNRREAPTLAELIIAEKLVTVCATLNEYPHIRWKNTSKLAASLAQLFHLKMTEFIGVNETWWYNGDGEHMNRDRCTLLLLDRADDCLSPLMHEFTYQAMVNDLLPVHDDRITYQSETVDPQSGTKDKEVLLNDNDELWVELRNKHIAEVVQILSTRIRDIVNSGAGSNLANPGKAGTMSLKQMADTIKKLPEYREVMSKLSQHMHIAHQCLDIFTKDSLMGLSELEQTLASGVTEEGRKPKLSQMVNEMEEYLKQLRDPVTKIRLLAIMIVSQNGLREDDRERLMTAAKLSKRECNIIDNFAIMGVPLVSESKSKKIESFFGLEKLSNSGVGEVDEESEYQGNRYQPGLKKVLEDLCNHKLSIEDYPSVLPLPEVGSSTGMATSARSRNPSDSARSKGSATSRWKKTSEAPKKSTGGVFSGGRQIVFIAGGMCHSEIRVVNAVTAKEGTEIVAGSTHIIKPKDFVKDIARLSK